MSCLRVPGEETTQDVTVTSWTPCAQQSLHGSIQTAIEDEVSMIRIVCSVFPHHTATNALNSGSVGDVLDTTRRNLAATTLPCNRPQ